MQPNPPADEKHRFLRAVDIFQDLTHGEVEEIGTRAPMKEVPAGRLIYSPLQDLEVLFILKQGRVRLYQITPEGRLLTIAILEAGTIFGEMALVGQALNRNYAEALDPCLLCLMSREDVTRTLLSDPRIAVRIAETLGKRLLAAEARQLELAYKNAPARLAGQLLRMAEAPAAGRQRAAAPQACCTHEALAALVGIHRETATKILNVFRQEGLVELKRGRIILLDPAGLARLSLTN